MMLPINDSKSEVLQEIDRLRKERNAIILSHFYQEPEIQDLADICGDSLALAKAAQKTDADIIVFSGVHFMAETAKILNPEKLVLVPDLEAGCSLADTCPIDEFLAFKNKHPHHVAVTYINSSAQVKAYSDIICTSSNAELIINSIPPERPIVFSPDINLGRHLEKKTGRTMVHWPGVCIVHDVFSETALLRLKSEYPNAEILAHPECREAVLRHSDFIGSTTAIIDRGKNSTATELIIATESGVLHQLSKLAPSKKLIQLPAENEACLCNECPYMRLNTIYKLRDCLRNSFPRIDVDPDLARRALLPIERMLSLTN